MTLPDFEIYPDEGRLIALAMTKLSAAFDFSSFSDKTKAIFDAAAHEEFAKVGIEIRVNWQEITRATLSGRQEPTGVWLPGIEPIGRTRPETERDHDRVRFGVVTGLADGQPGYVRADGRRTEDPIKKDFI